MRAVAVALVLVACAALGAAAESHSDWEAVELEPVPVRRALLQAADSGSVGYGGQYGGPAHRRLISTGGYGYGGPAHRRLIASGGYGEDSQGYGGPAHRRLISTGGYGYGGPAHRRLISTGGYGYGAEAADEAAGPRQPPRRMMAEVAAARRRLHAASAPVGAAVAGLPPPPAGQCYCRYDVDYHTFALGEGACKAALYTRCERDEAGTALPCGWLDAYYAGSGAGGADAARSLPHESDILAFVFGDCEPSAPCACASVAFDGSDAAPAVHGCCRDLHASCRTPFSGVECTAVEAFCREDQASPELLVWAQHKLRHSAGSCRAYKGLPFNYVPESKSSSKGAASKDAAAAAAPVTTVVEETAGLIEAGRAAVVEAPAMPTAGGPAPAGVSMIAAACAGGALVGAALVGIVSTLRAAVRDSRATSSAVTAQPAQGTEPLLPAESGSGHATQPAARHAALPGVNGELTWR